MGESIEEKNYDEEIESIECPPEKTGEDCVTSAGIFRSVG